MPRRRDASAEARRTEAKLIRFSPAELDAVIDRARSVRRPVACYIREMAIGTATTRARRPRITEALIRNVARVATLLTELATEAHGLPSGPQFCAATDELLALIRELDRG